jgi:hypothetical protein
MGRLTASCGWRRYWFAYFELPILARAGGWLKRSRLQYAVPPPEPAVAGVWEPEPGPEPEPPEPPPPQAVAVMPRTTATAVPANQRAPP